MGAGASALPDNVDEATAKAAAGEHWDQDMWDEEAGEDFASGMVVVAREQFLMAAKMKGVEVDGGDAAGANAAAAGGGGDENALLARLKAMTDFEREEEAVHVLEAATKRERVRKVAFDEATKAANMDYSKGFSGSAEDTKKEAEAAKLMRGGDSAEEEDPYLRDACENMDAAARAEVEALGKWMKLMGGSGCYVYIHSLTHEFAANKPPGYVDSSAVDAAEEAAGGLPTVAIGDVNAEIARIITEEKKTPLLLDGSEDRKLATFFSFKGVLVDGTKMALPLRDKARPKPKAFVEELRAAAVKAMKGGSTLCLDLGETEGSKAPLWSTLCKPDGLRKELFIEGGKGLTRNKMAFRKMWKDDEKEHGEAIPRDDFKFVVVSSIAPKAWEKTLCDEAIPSEHVYPVVVLANT